MRLNSLLFTLASNAKIQTIMSRMRQVMSPIRALVRSSSGPDGSLKWNMKSSIHLLHFGLRKEHIYSSILSLICQFPGGG